MEEQVDDEVEMHRMNEVLDSRSDQEVRTSITNNPILNQLILG